MGLNLNSVKQIQEPRPRASSTGSFWGRASEIANYDIKLFRKFGDKYKERFFSEIALLLDAGVDLPNVLKLSLGVSKKKNKVSEVYELIYDQISLGSSLATAMETTGQFNNFDCYSVLIGENTGELALVFNKLSVYYNKRIVQKRKIGSSLSYPVIVLITTIGAIYFMLKFVVPMFSETLARFGGELPPLTKFVIALTDNISWYFLTLLICLGLGYFFYYKNKHKNGVQKFISSVQMKIPFWGKFIRKTHLLQFAQSMELLLNAKVNIVESIQLTSKMVKYYPLKIVLLKIAEEIVKGEFFYVSMEKQSFFDPSMIVLIKIGEEVNQLDRIFSKLSKQYENELEYQSGIIISVLEPVMILLLACLVAVILIAMYLPMFKIGMVIK